MISKNLIKYIHSLELKKNRNIARVFAAEGPKVVGDLLETCKPKRIIATEEWYADSNYTPQADDVIVSDSELKRISFLQHPQKVMGLFPFFDNSKPHYDFSTNLYLALDGVQDPGNLGTIIRIADWFGISAIFCSNDTADVYNPKVIQATMGSIARVNVVYTDICRLIDTLPKGTPVYGTFLNGSNIYGNSLTPNGIIIMGNEGKGISADVATRVNKRILIPSYPANRPTAESLNVAIATAITCAEFQRQASLL